MGILAYATALLSRLEANLQPLDSSGEDKLTRFETGIYLTRQALDMLCAYLRTYEFKSEEEEIAFYKHHMTGLMAKSILYAELYKLQSVKPAGTPEEVAKFYRLESAEIKKYLARNQNLYNYLVLEKTNQDREFFLRSAQSPIYKPPLAGKLVDQRQCTVYTEYFAHLKAGMALADYLHTQQAVREGRSDQPYKKHGNLIWTGKKSDLMELVYALKVSGVLNHGTARLKEISAALEVAFQYELKDLYRSFQEIQSRKKNRTQFLESCRELLESYMEEHDAGSKGKPRER